MPEITTKNPIMIFIRGLPGSGKSYLTAALKNELGDSVVVLDPDAIDLHSPEFARHVEQATKEGVDKKLHNYRFLRGQAYQAIADKKLIIWNQPFTNLEIFHKMVGRLQDQAADNNVELPVLVVEVELDHKTAKERIQARKQQGGHGPSDNTFGRFISDYKSFKDDGYNTLTVYGDDDINKSVAAVMQAVRAIAQ